MENKLAPKKRRPPTNGKRFSKDYQPKRKKHTIFGIDANNMTRLGHKDIVYVTQNLLGRKKRDIEKLRNDEDKPLMVRTICKILLKEFEKGELKVTPWLIDRAFGKPKEHVEVDQRQVIINIDADDAKL